MGFSVMLFAVFMRFHMALCGSMGLTKWWCGLMGSLE